MDSRRAPAERRLGLALVRATISAGAPGETLAGVSPAGRREAGGRPVTSSFVTMAFQVMGCWHVGQMIPGGVITALAQVAVGVGRVERRRLTGVGVACQVAGGRDHPAQGVEVAAAGSPQRIEAAGGAPVLQVVQRLAAYIVRRRNLAGGVPVAGWRRGKIDVVAGIQVAHRQVRPAQGIEVGAGGMRHQLRILDRPLQAGDGAPAGVVPRVEETEERCSASTLLHCFTDGLKLRYSPLCFRRSSLPRVLPGCVAGFTTGQTFTRRVRSSHTKYEGDGLLCCRPSLLGGRHFTAPNLGRRKGSCPDYQQDR